MADTPTKTLADGTVVYNVGPGKYSRNPPQKQDSNVAPAQAPATPEPQVPAPRAGRQVAEADLASNNNVGRTIKDLKKGAADAAQGVVSGLLSGWDDEILGDEYSRAKKFRQARSAARSAEAEQDLDTINPALGYVVPTDAALTGEVGGAVAQAAGTGAALKGAGLIGKAGQAATAGQKAAGLATGGAVQGAIAGAGNAEGDAIDRVGPAAMGAATGWAGGKVLGGLAKGASRLFSGETARASRVLADEARVGAAGMSPADAAANPGGVAGQAKALREQGIGQDMFTSKSAMRDQAGQAVAARQAEREATELRMRDAQVLPGQAALTTGSNVAQRLRAAQKRFPEFGVGSEVRGALENEAAAVSKERVKRPGELPAPVPRAKPAQAKATKILDDSRRLADNRQTRQWMPPANSAEEAQTALIPRTPYNNRVDTILDEMSPDYPGLKPRRPLSMDALPMTDQNTVPAPLPENIGPRKGPPLPPKTIYDQPPRPIVEVEQDRLLSFDELGKKREFMNAKYPQGTPEANASDDIRRAYRDEQIALANQVEPGLGDKYGRAGELQQTAIDAQQALGRGQSANMPNPFSPASWWRSTAGQYTPNIKAHFQEGKAGLLSAMSPDQVNQGALQRGLEASNTLGQGMARFFGGAGGAMMTPAAQQGAEMVNDPALDEQERAIQDYQQSMNNLDYGHAKRRALE